MSDLVFTIPFPDLSREELQAVYDQTAEIRKAIERKLAVLPIERYADMVYMEVS